MVFFIQADVVDKYSGQIEANTEDEGERRSFHFLNGTAGHEAQARPLVREN